MRQLIPILALLAGPAHATQEYILPTLFDVTGVAAGDVLNIRQQPSAASPVIGSLSPDATRIEVVEERNGWARVNTGEGSGWASMRYLAYRSDVWDHGALPEGFRCFGTEPFWGIAADGGDLVLSAVDMEDRRHRIGAVMDTGVFRDPARAVLADGATLVATPQICSDGMSDRLFGLRATLVLPGPRPRMLNGCCSIQPRADRADAKVAP